MSTNFKNFSDLSQRSFWKRPEGVTGAIFLLGGVVGVGFLLATFGSALVALAQNTLYLGLMITLLAALGYVIFDPKMRNLIWYGYKNIMRWITSWFVQVDPLGILKNYVEDLRKNLRTMSKQIGVLRGQMRRLGATIQQNEQAVEQSMKLANQAKIEAKQNVLALELRKVGRLRESNQKLQVLYQRMEVLHRVLKKMYDNSEIMLEDLNDQVKLKEQERKAIRASHSAMQSAMNIISGNKDQRYLFDEAMEAMAQDVANKVGEMERFMDLSSNFMNSIDLQQGIFEDEGLKMLEEWERKSDSIFFGKEKNNLLEDKGFQTLDLNQKQDTKKIPLERPNDEEENKYFNLFDN